ncbi:hypothetical protein PARMER_02739 [Parabacteroides merdae ATCC 43184]|nr:hypothetical protein PARMER_02739 [Parabacteroides merdae ATCC 43184]
MIQEERFPAIKSKRAGTFIPTLLFCELSHEDSNLDRQNQKL